VKEGGQKGAGSDKRTRDGSGDEAKKTNYRVKGWKAVLVTRGSQKLRAVNKTNTRGGGRR